MVGEIGNKIRDEITTINNILKFEIVNFLIILNFREDIRDFRGHSNQEESLEGKSNHF